MRNLACTFIAAMGLLASAGCNNELSPHSQQQLAAARAAYQAGDDKTVLSLMDQFLQDNYRPARGEQGYYLRGLSRYRQQDIKGARADLEQVAGGSKDAQLRGQAFKALGDICYDQDDFPTAAEMYRQALDNLAESASPADAARFRLGVCLQRLGQWSQADLQFSRLMFLFPKGEAASAAGQRIHATAWTVHVQSFSQKSGADVLAMELRIKSISGVVVEPISAEGGMMFAVRVGRFAGYEQATEQLDAIRAIQGDACIVATK